MVMTHHRHPLLSRWLLATRYLKAQQNLHHSALYNPLILPSLETSLGVDVLLYPKVLLVLPVDVLLYPMILPSLGLDVLVCLMHHHRIVLPQVTLCPRHTGLGSEVSGRLYTAR